MGFLCRPEVRAGYRGGLACDAPFPVSHPQQSPASLVPWIPIPIFCAGVSARGPARARGQAGTERGCGRGSARDPRAGARRLVRCLAARQRAGGRRGAKLTEGAEMGGEPPREAEPGRRDAGGGSRLSGGAARRARSRPASERRPGALRCGLSVARGGPGPGRAAPPAVTRPASRPRPRGRESGTRRGASSSTTGGPDRGEPGAERRERPPEVLACGTGAARGGSGGGGSERAA